MSAKPLVSVNILNTNERQYLAKCLDCVLGQDYEPLEITLIDNASSDGSVELVRKAYPNVRIIENKSNLWYCAGHNVGIRAARGDFIQVLNVDVFIQPDFISKMMETMLADETCAAVQGKIWQYRGEDASLPEIIDTVGARVTRSRRNFDKGQGELDTGQYDRVEEIFGADGVAPLYRKKALDDIEIMGEYFDEDFLIYREIIDLSWRLRLRGWKTLYTPDAVAYHVRGFSPEKRSQVSPFKRRLSYRNRLLTMIKNESLLGYLRHGYRIIPFDIAMLGHIILREQHLLKAILDFFRLLPSARRKRKIIRTMRLVDDREILKWFE